MGDTTADGGLRPGSHGVGTTIGVRGSGATRPVAVLVGLALVVAVLALGSVPAAANPAGVAYQPPVEGPVVDGFRPPDQPWLAGNRGIDYATGVGDTVAVAAAGTVTFAGAVGGDLHVTVTHADGLRTTYSFLESVAVVSGQQLVAGEPVGTSVGRFHFGVRNPAGEYLDPRQLFAVTIVRLVPGGDDGAVVVAGPAGPGAASVVWGLLSHGVSMAGGGVVGVVPGLAAGGPVGSALAHYAMEFAGGGAVRSAALAVVGELGDQGSCTPVTQPAPRPNQRRIMVQVAGFGSTSSPSGIDAVDAGGLGYHPDDVLRFSYAGGRIPASGPSPPAQGPPAQGPPAQRPPAPLHGLPTSQYTATDSQGDLQVAARRLIDLLAQVAATAPGVPIDVVAHSQGGVVARMALAMAASTGALPAMVHNLVTLGTPHHGADLATAGAALGATPLGSAVFGLAGTLGLSVDPAAGSLGQLSELSAVSADPGGGGEGMAFPTGIRFTSVAARGDPVVPLPRTWAPGAVTTTVSVDGPSAHNALPGSPAATREIGLAIAGLDPTCRPTATRVGDALVGHGVATTHDALGASLLALALVL